MSNKPQTDLNCPVCASKPLTPITVAGVEVDRCERCGGAWYDQGEFEKLVDVAMRGFRATDYAPVSNRRCPRDGVVLKQMVYPQTLVTADVCPQCHGLWLDKGETKEIRRVRQHLRRADQLEQYAPVPGYKGVLIRRINGWIDALTDYSKYY